MTAERDGKRVLVIGLDGATWTLLDGWAREGHLPSLQRLRGGWRLVDHAGDYTARNAFLLEFNVHWLGPRQARGFRLLPASAK